MEEISQQQDVTASLNVFECLIKDQSLHRREYFTGRIEREFPMLLNAFGSGQIHRMVREREPSEGECVSLV